MHDDVLEREKIFCLFYIFDKICILSKTIVSVYVSAILDFLYFVSVCRKILCVCIHMKGGDTNIDRE